MRSSASAIGLSLSLGLLVFALTTVPQGHTPLRKAIQNGGHSFVPSGSQRRLLAFDDKTDSKPGSMCENYPLLIAVLIPSTLVALRCGVRK